MMNLSDIESVYFVGAGGIGMAALERYFLSRGVKVAGYDRTPSDLTHALQSEGVEIVYDDNVDLIPDWCRNPKSTLVVYTPAVPDSHAGLQYFRNNGFEVVKRAQLLGIITRQSKSLCFAGTHGKTTTSSMAAHILHTSPIGCNAFLGGILRNYNSNLLLSSTSEYTVIEADEFDRSFHWLNPYIAVITATDPDHLDIYGTEEAYLESFAHFTELIVPGGYLIEHTGLKLVPRTNSDVTTYTYSATEGDFHAENINMGNGSITFDFVAPDGRIDNISLGVPVEINIDNAVAAIAVCYIVGVDADSIRKAMASFQGPKRRFEFWLKEAGKYGKVIIDDYAHHPDELKAAIKSVKAIYPDRKLTVTFQPHLYSRTRDFAPQFAEALSIADKVVLLDIYPARELPIPGVTSKIIFDSIKSPVKYLCSKDKLVNTLKNTNFELLLVAGAGDIVNYLPEICDTFRLDGK